MTLSKTQKIAVGTTAAYVGTGAALLGYAYMRVRKDPAKVEFLKKNGLRMFLAWPKVVYDTVK